MLLTPADARWLQRGGAGHRAQALGRTPGTIRSSAPHLGDDTDAVLAEMGLKAEQIALLRSKGVVQ